MTFFTMYKSFFSALVSVIIMITTLSINAFARERVYPEKSFRAEVEITEDGETTPAVIYGQGALMRFEMNSGDEPVVQIVDMEKDQALMLFDVGGQKTAMRLEMDNALDRFGLNATALGPATGKKNIAGFQCSMYQIKESAVCLTNDNIALESVANSSVMRVARLQIGDQDSSLFEVPESYQVVDMGAMMQGIDPSMFDNQDGILGGLFNQAGSNSESSFLDGIGKIIDAEDDEAAGNAALGALLGQMGLPEGALSTDDTTAGVLVEGIEQETNLSDAEQKKAQALMQENQRRMDIIQREGITGLLRDAGLSESEIKDIERSQEKLGQMAQDHADKNKDLIDASIESADTNAETLDLEAQLDALNDRAEALADDGNVSETDKTNLQNDAEELLERVLGSGQ